MSLLDAEVDCDLTVCSSYSVLSITSFPSHCCSWEGHVSIWGSWLTLEKQAFNLDGCRI